ncbi:MAG: hypothetical protein H6678_15010 [Candidatus Delongbacteria bacterium]|nr:hypothetical protein [Candidatus Cloacimonadota bacterium]MCB9475109.1 hypothetical protein [Candidatus Delongbacteria bacterium]
MAETINEITIEWTDDDGKVLVKELKKEVLTSGAWSTILFAYQDLERASGNYGPVKFRVGRYQKRNGVFRPHSKFNISSVKQAKQLIGLLNTWIEEYGDQAGGEAAESDE